MSHTFTSPFLVQTIALLLLMLCPALSLVQPLLFDLFSQSLQSCYKLLETIYSTNPINNFSFNLGCVKNKGIYLAISSNSLVTVDQTVIANVLCILSMNSLVGECGCPRPNRRDICIQAPNFFLIMLIASLVGIP